MTDIYITLKQALKKLNPTLILESIEFDEEGERHRVKTWLDILPHEHLRRDSSIESDIYNNGKLKIQIAPPKDDKRSHYTGFYEPQFDKR